MSPYSLISKNKNKTLFIMLVFVIIFTGFFYLIGKYFNAGNSYLIMGLIISTLSTVGSYFYSDKIVLLTTGAKPANRKKHYDFYTTAENLSIASGLPMPKLYVINSPSMNAFATGRDPKHAVICVTTGLLEKLDRSDIEGVIAHELAHIKNYDILLSSIIAVLVGSIVIISDWFLRSFYWRSNSNNRGRNPVLGVLVILALIITPVLATLIQLAISRKREYLADASGVLITRNPNGLADALEKISQHSKLDNISPAVSHLFISNPLNSNKKNANWFLNLFSTHPPIEERIKILKSM